MLWLRSALKHKVETRPFLLAEAREADAPIFTSLLHDHPKGELDWVITPFDGSKGPGSQRLLTSSDGMTSASSATAHSHHSSA